MREFDRLRENLSVFLTGHRFFWHQKNLVTSLESDRNTRFELLHKVPRPADGCRGLSSTARVGSALDDSELMITANWTDPLTALIKSLRIEN